jgi:N-methylhydantoinase B
MFRLDTPGGGGYGDPTTRPAEHVLADVREGLVSREAAERDYGVVLTTDGTGVDAAATAKRRWRQ